MDDDPNAELWLSPEQLEHWVAVMGLITTLPAALEAQLKRDAGVNLFEYHVLAYLAEAPSGTRLMSDLAVQAQGSLSRLSHAVSRLERTGWVRRRACGGAGRRTEAILTEAGLEKIRAMAPGHVAEARRLVVDALTPAQFAALGEAGRRITELADPAAAAQLELTLRCAAASRSASPAAPATGS